MQRDSIRFISAYFIYVLYVLFLSFQNGREFPNYLRVLLIPLIVTVVGDLLSDIEATQLLVILKVFVVASLLYAVWVLYRYFPSYSAWLRIREYVFVSKNSAAQIWCTAIFVLAFLIPSRTRVGTIIRFAIMGLLMFICAISQCRTAILALGVVLVSFILFKAKHKGRWTILLTVTLVIALRIPAVRTFINQALMITKYSGTNLDTFSSRRLTYWSMALTKIARSPIIGTGRYYVDCSYLSVLAENGLVGFIIIEAIWIQRIVTCFRLRNDRTFGGFLFCATVFFLVEALFEGYPPFGPGASSFMYWLISTISIGKSCAEDTQYWTDDPPERDGCSFGGGEIVPR